VETMKKDLPNRRETQDGPVRPDSAIAVTPGGKCQTEARTVRPICVAERRRARRAGLPWLILLIFSMAFLDACGKVRARSDAAPAVTVGVTKVGRESLKRQITISSELVPFQEIDVYAKESGFVKQLLVDYGSRVKAGQLMAVLEIPELEAQLQVDKSAIANAG